MTRYKVSCPMLGLSENDADEHDSKSARAAAEMWADEAWDEGHRFDWLNVYTRRVKDGDARGFQIDTCDEDDSLLWECTRIEADVLEEQRQEDAAHPLIGKAATPSAGAAEGEGR